MDSKKSFTLMSEVLGEINEEKDKKDKQYEVLQSTYRIQTTKLIDLKEENIKLHYANNLHKNDIEFLKATVESLRHENSVLLKDLEDVLTQSGSRSTSGR